MRRAAKASAADKRFREASELRKQADADKQLAAAIVQGLRDNPKEMAAELRKAGIDPVKLAESWLAPYLEEELRKEEERQLSPEQKRTKELERKLAEYEAAESKRKEESAAAAKKAEEAKLQAEVERHRDVFAGIVEDALKWAESEYGLEQEHRSRLGFAVVAELQAALEQGIEIEPKVLARDAAAALTGIGRKVYEKHHKAELAEHVKNNPLATAKPVVGQKKAESAPAQKGKVTLASIQRELMMGRGFKK